MPIQHEHREVDRRTRMRVSVRSLRDGTSHAPVMVRFFRPPGRHTDADVVVLVDGALRKGAHAVLTMETFARWTRSAQGMDGLIAEPLSSSP